MKYTYIRRHSIRNLNVEIKKIKVLFWRVDFENNNALYFAHLKIFSAIRST